MFSLVCDLAYWLALVFGGPIFLVRRRATRKRLAPFRSRWNGVPFAPQGDAVTWIHGVSVGEVLAARKIVEELRAGTPVTNVFISTTTVAGFDVARRTYGAERVFYFPFDFSRCMRRAFDRLRPRLIVLIETELWPNMLHFARRRDVPVVIANGKVSERSARGYRRILRVLPGFLDAIRSFCVQNETYAARLKDLGIGTDRIRVTGTIKADNLADAPSAGFGIDQRRSLGLGDDDKVVVAGSTHPGEEAMVLDAFMNLHRDVPTCRLVLAPRHLERLGGIERLVADRGLRFGRKSAASTSGGVPEVLLVDTMGELQGLFAAADVVFLGGSLVPVGGHNILEPAVHGRAVIVGPHTWTVSSLMDDFRRCDAVVEVDGAAELLASLRSLLLDDVRRIGLGTRARALVERHRGASRRTVEVLRYAMETSVVGAGSR